jgi:hypothetical protein
MLTQLLTLQLTQGFSLSGVCRCTRADEFVVALFEMLPEFFEDPVFTAGWNAATLQVFADVRSPIRHVLLP